MCLDDLLTVGAASVQQVLEHDGRTEGFQGVQQAPVLLFESLDLALAFVGGGFGPLLAPVLGVKKVAKSLGTVLRKEDALIGNFVVFAFQLATFDHGLAPPYTIRLSLSSVQLPVSLVYLASLG